MSENLRFDAMPCAAMPCADFQYHRIVLSSIARLNIDCSKERERGKAKDCPRSQVVDVIAFIAALAAGVDRA